MADPVGILINIALQAAISLVISALSPKPNQKGPRLDDRQMTSSTYGEHLPIGYGTIILGGNVIWGTEIEEVARRRNIGKGNPFSAGTMTTYYYYANFAVAFARREAASLLSIYADGKLIYGSELKDGVYTLVRMEGLSFNFYPGSDTQDPDPLMVADVGADACPAYRGTCYIVFNRLPLKNFGNRVPQIRVVLTFLEATEQASYTYEIDNGGNYVIHLHSYDYDRKLAFATGSVGSFDNSLAAHDIFSGEIVYSVTDNTADAWFRTTIFDTLRGGGNSPYLLGGGRAWRNGYTFGYKSTLAQFGVRMDDVLNGSSLDWYNTYIADTYADGSHLIHIGGFTTGARDHNIVALPRRSGSDTYYFVHGAEQNWCVARIDPSSISGVYMEKGISPLGSDAAARAAALPPTCHSLHQGAQYLNEVTGNGWVDVLTLWGDTETVGSAKRIMVDRIGETMDMTGEPYSGLRTLFTFAAGEVGEECSIIYAAGEDIVILRNESNIFAFYMDSFNNYAGRVKLWEKLNQTWGYDYYVDTGGLDNTHRLLGNTYTIWGDLSPTPSRIQRLDLRTGVVLEDRVAGPFTLGNGPSDMNFANLHTWDEDLDALVGFFHVFFLEPFSVRGTENLQTVVEDIISRTKLTTSDINATALATKQVRGYLLARSMPYRDALEPLATAYNFHGVEENGVIRFRFNDAVSDKTIPEDDLLRSGFEAIFEEARGMELETPRGLFVTHRDPDQYDIKGTQGARRITTPEQTVGSVGEMSVELPLTLSTEEAAQIAERILYDSWVQRESVKFRLPHRYLDLLANDNLTITAEGRTETVKIQRITVGANLELEIEAVVVDGEVYTSRLPGVTPIGPPSFQVDGSGLGVGVTPPFSTDVDGFLIDSPLLRVTDLTSRGSALIYFTAGASYGGDTFVGATLATDYNASGYEGRAVLGAGTGMTWGQLSSVMPDIPDPAWNSIQEVSVTVTIYAGETELVSVSIDDLIGNDLNNAMLIRADGTMEIISFRDVASAGGSSYTLTGFMRGKRGTSTMAEDYAAGTYFVLLDPQWVTAYSEDLARLSENVDYRIYPNSGTPNTLTTQTHTYRHRSLMPFAPVHVARDDTAGDITISWVRQDRLLSGWPDLLANAPLNEDAESYSIDILSGSGGAVVRTLTSATTSVVYDSVGIAYDFVSFPTTLYVRVYQLSGQVGRGFSYEAALTE